MENLLSLRIVYDRKNTASSEKKGLIQIEIRTGKEKKYISTGISVFPFNFDKANSRIHGTDDDFRLNSEISSQIRNIYKIAENLADRNIPVTSTSVKKELELTSQKEKYDGNFISYVYDKLSSRKDIRESTRVAQRKIIDTLHQFGEISTFLDITPQNIRKFDDYLHGKGYKQTTVYSYHKILKTYINDAILDGYIKSNPYKSGLKINRGQGSIRRYLTPDELKKIIDAKISNSSISNVRELFLFQCYTGLAYADLLAFSKNEGIVMEHVGRKYILRDKRRKTGTGFYIVLIPQALEILRRNSFSLHVISNAQYNLRLKVLAEYAGLEKPLTSHMARHTFAVLNISAGVPIEYISRMLGHTNISTTQIYAKVMDKNVEDGLQKMSEALKRATDTPKSKKV